MSPALAEGHLCTCFLSVDSAKCPRPLAVGNEKTVGLSETTHHKAARSQAGKGGGQEAEAPTRQLC